MTDNEYENLHPQYDSTETDNVNTNGPVQDEETVLNPPEPPSPPEHSTGVTKPVDDEDDDTPVYKDGLDENGEPIEPLVPPEVADKAKEVADKAKNAFGSILGAVKTGWEDYTQDVRVEKTDDAVSTANNATTVTSSDSGTSKGTAPVGTPPTPPMEFKVPSATGIISSAKNIGGSFLDGLLGRPKAESVVRNATKGGWRNGIRIVTWFFAAIGVIAVFRAATDAFRPRH